MESRKAIDVAVVLPTYRRPEQLASSLDAIASQHPRAARWFLVVVDNDDPPGCESVFRTLAPDLPPRSVYVRSLERGACHARNRGIEVAIAEQVDAVAFIDDDVTPAPDWLENLIRPLVTARCEAVAGAVYLDWRVPRPPWLSETLDGYLAHFSPYEDERLLGVDDVLLTANAAFELNLLQRTGGFDAVLGPHAGVPLVNDDIDLLRRCLDAGARVLYVPDAQVIHELPAARLELKYLLRRVYAQGRSDWLLDRKTLRGQEFRGVPMSWRELRRQLDLRRREGFGHRTVAYKTLCDVARFLGFLREAVRPSA